MCQADDSQGKGLGQKSNSVHGNYSLSSDTYIECEMHAKQGASAWRLLTYHSYCHEHDGTLRPLAADPVSMRQAGEGQRKGVRQRPARIVGKMELQAGQQHKGLPDARPKH